MILRRFRLGVSALAPPSALTIGAALALSSTAIVMPVLAEIKRLRSTVGRATFSVLLFQDLAVAPLLVMAAMLAGGEEQGLGWAFRQTSPPPLSRWRRSSSSGVLRCGRCFIRWR